MQRLRAVLEEAGPRYGTFVNLAFALHRLGRLEDALLVLDEAEAVAPDRPEAALARASIHREGGDADAAAEALAAYRDRIEHGDTPPAVYYHTAILTSVLEGDFSAAEAQADEALGAHPASAPLLLLAGALAERNGNNAEADRCYRQAAEEDPSLPQAYKGQGDIAYRRGLHDEALEHYDRAIELDPELGDDILTKLGNIHYKRMEREAALELWQRALALNPDNEVVRNNLDVVANAGA